MEKIALITGVNGQDGSYLAELLLDKGYTVVGLIRRTVADFSSKTQNLSNVIDSKNLILEEGDVSDLSSVANLISKYRPKEIYNLAAQSHVGTSFKTPVSTTEINLNGCLNILETIKNVDRKIKFYQASTSEMFGDNIQCPQNENSFFSPVSPYACSKLAAHHLVGTYRKSYGMFACSGILFNHESPRRGENFVTRKITKAAARIKMGLQDELRLGNLSAQRDWGFAKDFTEGMWMMLQHTQPDDYVLATGQTNSVRDFLNYVFEYANLDPEKFVIIDPKFYRPCEVPKLWGDYGKAKRILNWEPKTSFKQLAVMMFKEDYERENKKN
jgi:GDPmannose 4,6-dehydratase